MSTNVRFRCTQAPGRVAIFLPTKTKGSGRARALLNHPAIPPRIVLTQPFIMCVSSEYMRYSTGPRERQVREGHPEDRNGKCLTRGVGKACYGNSTWEAYGRDPRIRAIRSRSTQVGIVIAARPEPRSSRREMRTTDAVSGNATDRRSAHRATPSPLRIPRRTARASPCRIHVWRQTQNCHGWTTSCERRHQLPVASFSSYPHRPSTRDPRLECQAQATTRHENQYRFVPQHPRSSTSDAAR